LNHSKAASLLFPPDFNGFGGSPQIRIPRYSCD
jgi:hypothetical protein